MPSNQLDSRNEKHQKHFITRKIDARKKNFNWKTFFFLFNIYSASISWAWRNPYILTSFKSMFKSLDPIWMSPTRIGSRFGIFRLLTPENRLEMFESLFFYFSKVHTIDNFRYGVFTGTYDTFVQCWRRYGAFLEERRWKWYWKFKRR